MTKGIEYGCLIVLVLGVLFMSLGMKAPPDQSAAMDRPPRIHPDYADVTIPPNIAPLHFQIQETGVQYFVKIHSTNGTPVLVSGRSSKISIPQASWRALLTANRGEGGFSFLIQRRMRRKYSILGHHFRP